MGRYSVHSPVHFWSFVALGAHDVGENEDGEGWLKLGIEEGDVKKRHEDISFLLKTKNFYIISSLTKDTVSRMLPCYFFSLPFTRLVN